MVVDILPPASDTVSLTPRLVAFVGLFSTVFSNTWLVGGGGYVVVVDILPPASDTVSLTPHLVAFVGLFSTVCFQIRGWLVWWVCGGGGGGGHIAPCM